MARLTSRIAAVLAALASAAAQGAAYVRLPGGDFDSVLPQNAPGQPQRVRIEPFEPARHARHRRGFPGLPADP